MQKWEYAHVQTLRGRSDYTVNGIRFELERNTRFDSLLNNLGKDGWELVDAEVRVAEGSLAEFFFKRPLQS